jgi:hypothetical protein
MKISTTYLGFAINTALTVFVLYGYYFLGFSYITVLILMFTEGVTFDCALFEYKRNRWLNANSR